MDACSKPSIDLPHFYMIYFQHVLYLKYHIECSVFSVESVYSILIYSNLRGTEYKRILD